MNVNIDLASRLSSDAMIEEEIARRVTKTDKLRTLNVSQQARQNGLLNEGTIVTLVGHLGSDYLEGLADALKNKNESKTRLFCEAITQRTRSETLGRQKPFDVRSAPMIVDVMYGNIWLAKHLVITPDTHIALSVAVWSGGKLDDQQFRLVQHVLKGLKRFDIQVLTILIPPKLTKIERAMVNAVPGSLSEIHLKGPSVAWTAGSVSINWDSPEQEAVAEKQPEIERAGVLAGPNRKILLPTDEVIHQQTTVQDRQVQQNDTKQQQQQLQGHQEQYQVQKQQDAATNHQEQQQFQNANTEYRQQQQQQLADGKQQQRQNAHDAATGFQGSKLFYDTEMTGGFVVRPWEQERYVSFLERIDFESMDATQSVKELLRLRERLITVGLS
jgi:hypothetical protein